MKSIHVYISHISLLRHSKIKTQLRRNDKINEAVVHISGQIIDITAVAQQMSASATHIMRCNKLRRYHKMLLATQKA